MKTSEWDKRMGISDTISELKEFARRWPVRTLLTVINEELHKAQDIETKVEILIFKSAVLEKKAFGKCTDAYCNPKNSEF